MLQGRQPKHLLKEIQLQQLSQRLFQERPSRAEAVPWHSSGIEKQQPAIEELKSKVDAKQLDVSEQKSGGLIVQNNEQHHEELTKMELLQTPDWSSGVWLLVWNMRIGYMHRSRKVSICSGPWQEQIE